MIYSHKDGTLYLNNNITIVINKFTILIFIITNIKIIKKLIFKILETYNIKIVNKYII